MRYFIESSYHGGKYAGWQRQPHDITVQQILEEAFSLILREDIRITGCGRTDAGVHARQYFFHFDSQGDFTPDLLLRFNKYLPPDIALHHAYRVSEEAHARYAAIRRTYQYYITYKKDALAGDLSFWYPYARQLDTAAMQDVAGLLTAFQEFKTFCKEGSGAKHHACTIFASRWTFTDDEAIYTISANRFLRGMVRLIVGACLQAGRGSLHVDEVRTALETQAALQKAESAPPQGLHLINVEYPPGLLADGIL